MKIGLFYGSSTCYTEMAAEKIRDILGDDLVELHDVKETDLQLMESYLVLILGIPTWDFGEIQEDWLAVWEQLPQLDLSGKIVAMYGMGDQVDYSDWFLDALGYLHQQLQSSGKICRLLAGGRLYLHQPESPDPGRQTLCRPGT